MDENVFRIVVTAAVVLASLAFLVQAIVMIALYKVARKTQGDAATFIGKMEPVVAKAGPVLEKAGTVFERVEPVVDRIGSAIDQAMPAIRKLGPVLDEARLTVSKAGTFIDRATDIATTTNQVIADARPQVKQISLETLEITRLGREQVERVGDLIHEAGDKARARLEQIDRSVDSTIEHIENAGSAIKRAALTPVQQANGIAAGIGAAFASLRKRRRSSVDSATQDEEMFI
jgi:ABC-type transporter Mla subunit MlaD